MVFEGKSQLTPRKDFLSCQKGIPMTHAEVPNLVQINEQVDDFLVGTTNESIAVRTIERIGERVNLQLEKKNAPIAFLDLCCAKCRDGH